MLKHVNRFPWAILSAVRTTDTTFEIDFNKPAKIEMLRTRDKFNTIDRANYNACLTTCAGTLINDRKLFWLFLSWGFMRVHLYFLTNHKYKHS